MSQIVVVAPHPDDEVLGCGGSLVQHARAGHAIPVITISRRVRSRVEEDLTDADDRIESESAHRILGVSRHVALDLPGRSPSATEGTAKLVTEFRINPPEILYVPHDNDARATTLDDFSSECKREAGARRTPVHAPRGWI